MNALHESPVSRRDNPFATCWTRPGALPWFPVNDTGIDRLVTELLEHSSGQIVGPHGSGKSTLLNALAEELQRRGEVVIRWTIDGGRPAAPRPRLTSRAVLLLDGFEQLDSWDRVGLLGQQWRYGVRLVFTTHRPTSRTRAALLAELSPTAANAVGLFRALTAARRTPLGEQDFHASFARHNGNLREVWFDLYDRHEQSMRKARTLVGCGP